jgi:putative ABC transport system permease protein
VVSQPLWRIAWRRLRRRPLQYILLVLGVAVGVAMMVSVDVANQSARRAFELSTNAVAGKATHRIVGGPSGLDEAVYPRLRTELGFELAAPVVEGFVVADGLGGQLMRLVGVDPFAEPPFRDYFGRQASTGQPGEARLDLTAFLTQANAVFVSAALAEQYGLALGDELALTIGGRAVTVRIAGLLVPADDGARRARPFCRLTPG